MILIEHPETGERCLVESLDGYAGWKMVADDAPLPPEDGCDWCSKDQRWKRNKARCDRADRLSAMRDPERMLAMFDELVVRIEALETGIADGVSSHSPRREK